MSRARTVVGLTLACAAATVAVYLGAQVAARAATTAIATEARALAVKNEHDSVVRSVETCSRANVGRAYLLVRAIEFTKSTGGKPSYTTVIAPMAWAILDCNRTVANHGRPVPVPQRVEDAYLALYRRGRVPILDGSRLVGSVGFTTYFNSPRH